jgi:hypothetical protein
VVEVDVVDMLLWGPGLDAELDYRRERMAAMWGRPGWVDRVTGSLAARRAARRHPHRQAPRGLRVVPGSGAGPVGAGVAVTGAAVTGGVTGAAVTSGVTGAAGAPGVPAARTGERAPRPVVVR